MAYQIKFQGLGVKQGDNAVLATDQVITLKEVDEAKRKFVAVASTETEDRDKDVLRTAGWKLENYLKNPIGLWCHDYHAVPVFKCARIRKDEAAKSLIFEPEFADYDFAKLVFDLYVKGFMNAFSVGFIPLKVAPREADQPWWASGQEYTEQELLEISSVPVPANPEALAEIRSVVKDHKPTLLESGFGSRFVKSAEHGLYIPVQDPGLFTDARIVALDKGIKVVSGMPVADPETKVAPPVAYLFDPEVFNAKSAHDWLTEHVPTEQQRKYFDLKPKAAKDAEKPFEVEIIEVKEATALPNLEVLEGLLGKSAEGGTEDATGGTSEAAVEGSAEGKETEGEGKGAVEDNTLALGAGGETPEETGDAPAPVTASFLAVTFALLDSDQNPIEGKTLTKTIEVKNGVVDMEALMGTVTDSIGKEILANLAEIKQLVVDISAKTGETKTDGEPNAKDSDVVLEIVESQPAKKDNGGHIIELEESAPASPGAGTEGSQGVAMINLTEQEAKAMIQPHIAGGLKELLTNTLAEMGLTAKA